MDQPDTVSDEDAHIGVAYMLCEDVPQVDAKGQTVLVALRDEKHKRIEPVKQGN